MMFLLYKLVGKQSIQLILIFIYLKISFLNFTFECMLVINDSANCLIYAIIIYN